MVPTHSVKQEKNQMQMRYKIKISLTLIHHHAKCILSKSLFNRLSKEKELAVYVISLKRLGQILDFCVNLKLPPHSQTVKTQTSPKHTINLHYKVKFTNIYLRNILGEMCPIYYFFLCYRLLKRWCFQILQILVSIEIKQ